MRGGAGRGGAERRGGRRLGARPGSVAEMWQAARPAYAAAHNGTLAYRSAACQPSRRRVPGGKNRAWRAAQCYSENGSAKSGLMHNAPPLRLDLRGRKGLTLRRGCERMVGRMEESVDGFVDVSVVLGAGVYALVRRGVVIYVGKSRSVYQRVYAHRSVAGRAARGKAIPSWLPIKGFVFDEVWVRPCHVDRLDALEAEMIERYKPRFNQAMKTPAKVTGPIPLRVGAVTVTLNEVVTGEMRRI